MFEIYPHTAFFLYLGTILLGIFAVWLWGLSSAGQLKQRPDERTVQQCEYCQHKYLRPSGKSTTQCPACQLWNTVQQTPSPKGKGT